MSRAQVSVEYTLIMGFVAAISIPLLIIYFNFSEASSEEINGKQLVNIARKVVDSAESVYYLGEPSQTMIKTHIPTSVQEATIENSKVIIFKLKTSKGVSEIVEVSPVNITGSLPITQGSHNIILKAKEDYVEISYD